MPVEVNGQDHLRLGRDGALELPGVHGEGVGVHIDEHRPRTVQEDGLAGGDEGVGDGDDLVLGPHAEGLQGKGQGVGAVGHSGGVPDSAPGGELGLEQAAVLSLDEPAGLDDARDRGVDRGLDPKVLGAEVDHRHRAFLDHPDIVDAGPRGL